MLIIAGERIVLPVIMRQTHTFWLGLFRPQLRDVLTTRRARHTVAARMTLCIPIYYTPYHRFNNVTRSECTQTTAVGHVQNMKTHFHGTHVINKTAITLVYTHAPTLMNV